MSEENEDIRRVRLRIRGRVQGVGFRANARRRGRRLGVDLTARNLDDGSVQIEAEGPNDAVEEFLAWARTGPPAASVRVFVYEDLPEAP